MPVRGLAQQQPETVRHSVPRYTQVGEDFPASSLLLPFGEVRLSPLNGGATFFLAQNVEAQ
jgi:hypothetical protein